MARFCNWQLFFWNSDRFGRSSKYLRQYTIKSTKYWLYFSKQNNALLSTISVWHFKSGKKIYIFKISALICYILFNQLFLLFWFINAETCHI